MKILRYLVGRIVLLVDFLTSPRPKKRPTDAQLQIDAQTKSLTLYEFQACPFCVKVRRQAKRLGLKIERRDAMRDADARAALLAATGRVKVPVLRITDADGSVRWMPESTDINAYLSSRFADA